jgi:hypothetical protein
MSDVGLEFVHVTHAANYQKEKSHSELLLHAFCITHELTVPLVKMFCNPCCSLYIFQRYIFSNLSLMLMDRVMRQFRVVHALVLHCLHHANMSLTKPIIKYIYR